MRVPPPPAPIRVWLEPGYDGGQVAAWMLDLPGCFVAGPDRATALARVPSAVGAFADWLAEHGEAVAVPATDERVVVEVVATEVLEGGYHRMAIFEADRHAVDPAEVEAVARRLAFARADLVDLLARVAARESAAGPLPGGRDAAAMLRHVAGVEAWLAGRLDSARYEGPLEGEPGPVLAGVEAWAVEHIREDLRREPATGDGPPREVTDGKGEHWTLAKVLRRLVYHRLDHLGDLERRLARADRAADRLVLRKDVLVDPVRLAELFRAVGWYRRVADHGRLARMLEGSTEMVSAWDGERLVGFARSISDDAFNAYVGSVAVHPRWQGTGVGQRLIRALLENNDQIRFVLTAVEGLEGFYEGLGFERDPHAMVRPRRQ